LTEEALRLSKNVQRGVEVRLSIRDEIIVAYEGETIAAALIAAGHRTLRHTPSGSPRGIFCGIGVCYDCLVTVESVGNVRACVTPVRAGMKIIALSSTLRP
jgi:predicted molibdopterin-dependent oxidoreductase YjgC